MNSSAFAPASMLDIVYRDTVCAAVAQVIARLLHFVAGIPLHGIVPQNQGP
jgi:hypothetical protein